MGRPNVSHLQAADTASIPHRGIGGQVVELAAWKRLRHRPDGGQWWGASAMWTWDQAAASCWGWPA
jgi:hypothetical protein